ncbi:MAG: methylated-DNA--[protein]-cysteine S-methyltransferase [Desulfobaccales bacterium]
MPLRDKHPPEPFTARVMMETPLGLVLMTFSDMGLQRLDFPEDRSLFQEKAVAHTPEAIPVPEKILEDWRNRTIEALEGYFAGKLVSFENLILDVLGTTFYVRVWQELRRIPYGETVSYQRLARLLGKPQAARAVGQACGANPLPLIIPCHRVIAANGSLGGFSSGLPRKRWLLEHEQVRLGKVSAR